MASTNGISAFFSEVSRVIDEAERQYMDWPTVVTRNMSLKDLSTS